MWQVDDDVRALLEKVLETYVYTWYSYISADDMFVDSVRHSIAAILTRLVCRLSEVRVCESVNYLHDGYLSLSNTGLHVERV